MAIVLTLTGFSLSSKRLDVVVLETFAVKGSMFSEEEKEFWSYECLVFQLRVTRLCGLKAAVG